MLSANQIEKLRNETPGVKHRIHLNNAGAALMPQKVTQVIVDYIELESMNGGYELARDKADEIARFYTSTALLLHTKAQNIAYTSNATDSYIKALSSINFKSGDIILTTKDDYVSNQISFLQLHKLKGIEVIRAEKTPRGGVDLNSMSELIKRHQPKLVAVTHVPTNSGLVQPIESIGQMCREQGSLYLVDACQSAGQIDLNVQDIQCDFLSATMRKFLRGPRGAGFLYVSDRVLEGDYEPIFMDLHSAEWLKPDVYEAVNTGKRFEIWEKPYALLLGSKAAVEVALEVGIKKIEARVPQLAAHCREKLREIGQVRILDTGERQCGIVTLTLDHMSGEEIKAQLDQAKINTSLVSPESALIDFIDKKIDWALRISPHYYNTFKEIDTFIETFKNIIRS